MEKMRVIHAPLMGKHHDLYWLFILAIGGTNTISTAYKAEFIEVSNTQGARFPMFCCGITSIEPGFGCRLVDTGNHSAPDIIILRLRVGGVASA